MFFIQKALNKFNVKNKTINMPPPRDFEVDEDMDYYRFLEPGDIILCRFGGKKDFTGGVICEMTSSPYSHAEVHIRDGYDISAGTHGVTFIDGYKRNVFGRKGVIGKTHFGGMDIVRLKGGLTREQRLIIQAKLMQALLLPYDYINLFCFAFLKNKSAIRRAGNDAYVCSELVSWAYKNADIDLIKSRPESIEAPCDIGRSDVLDYIGTFVKGEKVDGNYRNEFMNLEYSVLSKMVSNFMGLFTRRDEFYKGLYLNKTMLEGESE